MIIEEETVLDKTESFLRFSPLSVSGMSYLDIGHEGILHHSKLTRPKKTPRKQLTPSERNLLSPITDGRVPFSSSKKERQIEMITQVLKKVRVMDVRSTLMANSTNK